VRANRMRLGTLVVLVAVLAGPIQGFDEQLTPAPPAGGQISSATAAQPGPLPAPPVVRGRYLDAVPSMIRGPGAGWNRLTLVADITPKPGMRVYAPGNRGYTPIQLTLDEARDRNTGPTQYPKANVYLFAPLNERVQVFDAPFRLSRDVTARSGWPSGGTITGRLEYQACDDKVCYLPQALSLTWALTPP